MMMDVTDDYLEGGGEPLRDLVWDTAHRMLEEWTGQELAKTSFYGIRMYATNAVLAPHVDRMPLVTSAVINVAQDVEEDWVLELWGHDGKAYNVSMEVGDMVMYESHSVIHGRPWPLKGKYFANV
jgi:prolyl 4-hydroxylase